MTFKYFVHKYNIKKTTSNMNIYEVLKNIERDSKVGIHLRDGDFSTNYGIVNLHPSRRTHWVAYKNENYLIHILVPLIENNPNSL